MRTQRTRRVRARRVGSLDFRHSRDSDAERFSSICEMVKETHVAGRDAGGGGGDAAGSVERAVEAV